MLKIPKKLLFEIVKKFDLESITKICLTSTNLYQSFCQNEDFWLVKIKHDFGGNVISEMPPNLPYLQYYGRLERSGTLFIHKMFIKNHVTRVRKQAGLIYIIGANGDLYLNYQDMTTENSSLVNLVNQLFFFNQKPPATPSGRARMVGIYQYVMSDIDDIVDTGQGCMILTLNSDVSVIGEQWQSPDNFKILAHNVRYIGSTPTLLTNSYYDVGSGIFFFFYITKNNDLYVIREDLRPQFVASDVKSASINQFEYDTIAFNLMVYTVAVLYFDTLAGTLYKYHPDLSVKPKAFTDYKITSVISDVVSFDVGRSKILYVDHDGQLNVLHNSGRKSIIATSNPVYRITYMGDDNFTVIDKYNNLYNYFDDKLIGVDEGVIAVVDLDIILKL